MGEKRLFSLSYGEEGVYKTERPRAKMISSFNLWITQHRFFLKTDVDINSLTLVLYKIDVNYFM